MSEGIASAFAQHQRLIWGLCYRMLGTTADADEVLQETFVRALQTRPAEDRALRPWLVRVACNLARDRLRRRRRQPYHGQWLPSPIDTGPQAPIGWIRQPSLEPLSPEAQYGLQESISYAWLVALEALTPNQRSVLVLRDVLDLSTRETARTLGISESNVKVTLHRARKVLGARHAPSTEALAARQSEAATLLSHLGAALHSGDLEAIKALLSDDIAFISDGGGEFHAAMKPVLGPDRVARLYLGLWSKDPGVEVQPRLLNGLPAVIASWPEERPGFASRLAVLVDTREGQATRLWSVLASSKLGA